MKRWACGAIVLGVLIHAGVVEAAQPEATPGPSAPVAPVPPASSARHGSGPQAFELPPAGTTPRWKRLHFDAPAIDSRENFVLGTWPSMAQSLAYTQDFYYLLHGAVMSIPYPASVPRGVVALLDYGAITVLDFFATWAPFGAGWMHEEWHRAVMGRHGIDSFNEMWKFPVLAELVSVNHVGDAELVELKRAHPADQARLSAAGIEGDFALGLAFDKDRFFFETRGATLAVQWLTTANAIGYMLTAGQTSTNAETDAANQREGTNVSIRDFTGFDPDGWVYDLFRPDEPYAARGPHPSGVGIDRYRAPKNLTRRELDYLQAQGRLSLINLLDPNLIGYYEFDAGTLDGAPCAFNASTSHVMAPFGYSLALNLFAKAGRYGAFGELRAYVSESLVLPGVAAELVRFPLPILRATLTPRARLWWQPKHLRFDASSAQVGAAVEARLNVPVVGPAELYAEVDAKSAGWMVGNAFLGPSLNFRTGFEAVVF
jgi:hypothetical protein